MNSNPGSYGSSTTVPVITVNGKGLITGVSAVAITGGKAEAVRFPLGHSPRFPAPARRGRLYFATDQPAGQQIYTCSSREYLDTDREPGRFRSTRLYGRLARHRYERRPTIGLSQFVCRAEYVFRRLPRLPQTTPANSSATCTPGQLWADANYVYSCTATNTIKRAALSSF